MARYVVVSFEDNKEADAFIAAIEHPGFIIMGQAVDPTSSEATFQALSEKVFVRGLYMQPTQFCECAEVGPWTRGSKYGLWVHTVCKKPSKKWARGDHWFASLGKNLLPVSEEAPEWRGEGVSGHRFDAETKQWINVETGVPWGGKSPIT